MRNFHNLIKNFYFFSRIVLILILLFAISPQKALAATIPYLITNGVPARPPVTVGETFFQKDIIINYTSGNIILSRNSDGTGNTWADDALNITVTRDNSSPLSFTHSYQTNCTQLDSFPPKDITHLFGVGANRVHVALYDICGFSIASDPIHLVNTNAPGPTSTPTPTPTPTTIPTPTPPQPFLDLPWDYESKGMNFNEAALTINSFFDHEYPLLSRKLSLPEPGDSFKNIINYLGIRANRPYSSHDGYDYGNPAKVEFEDYVLAAGSGIAIYINTCGPCGNAIYIDHENGFQTRYYHLQYEGLITNIPNQPVRVISGRSIGKVGFTGNVTPKGEEGAHIHFMVIEDKNKDGNFEDNIPDGLVDPFGWQSKDPDPWENYSFIYNGSQRTGNKSYYLWKKHLDGLNANIPANGGIFKTGKYSVELPEDTVAEGSTIEIKAAPSAKESNNVESVGSVMDVILKDPLGSLITILTNPMLVVIDFSQADISRFKAGTLSIYSSTDRENWVKEESFIDFLNKKASAQVDHLTYFALMGERLDTIAPTTTSDLQGEKGQGNWFRTDVQAVFNPVDNEGGLGVKYTAYKLENEDWQKYTTPLEFTTEGHHKIEYYSEDKDGNIEDVKTIEFDIDKTPPEAEIGYDLSSFDTVITGKDNLTTTSTTIDTSSKLQPKYTVTDQAGNKLLLNTGKIKLGKQVALSIKKLQYNNNSIISLDPNVFFTLALTDKANKIKQLDQYYTLKDDKKIFTLFTASSNTTKIYTKAPGSTTYTREDKPGIVLLQLFTQQGSLKYKY